jgi:hypothetical protein
MSDGEKKRDAALYTLAGTVVTTLGAIATHHTPALLVTFIVIAAICLIFTAVFVSQWRHDSSGQGSALTAGTGPGTNLHPERLAGGLDAMRREHLELAMHGVVDDIANAVGMSSALVRSNLFSLIPDTDELGMVQDLWCHMDRPEERTIRMKIGQGSTGVAWQTGNSNRVIWNDGWGESTIRDEEELQKVHPELRWILTVPIFGSQGAGAKLVLNVDGLRTTPSADDLAVALGHLPRFAQGISRVLVL